MAVIRAETRHIHGASRHPYDLEASDLAEAIS
jgi:hypothetical protein